jgi:hypothetical protein
MTINEDTGCIKLPEIGTSITADLSRAQFLKIQAFTGASVLVRNEPWCSYRLPDIAQTDFYLCLLLQFHGDRLFGLSLSLWSARFGTSWSEERELARKAFHEHWLTNELCVRLGHYQWGDISSDYDAKGGSSSITIRYAHHNA